MSGSSYVGFKKSRVSSAKTSGGYRALSNPRFPGSGVLGSLGPNKLISRPLLIKAVKDALRDPSTRLLFLPEEVPSPPNVDLPLPPPFEEKCLTKQSILEGDVTRQSVLKTPVTRMDWTRD